MGYLNNQEKTDETIDSHGWLKTGDLAKIDVDGYLYITGRIKEIVITAGGENIAPLPIEEAIKEQLPHLISNVMLVGDKQKFLSVLVTLKVSLLLRL
jgi:long-chain-fatty-acid--CoA ligase ACSBG